MKKVVLFVLLLAVLVPFVWVLIYKYEGTKPQADVNLPSLYLKKSYEMSLKISDQGAGLRQVMVSILQNGNEKILVEKKIPLLIPLESVFRSKKLEDLFVIPVESHKYGMTDGEAVIRIMVSDFSWRSWNKGNVFYAEKRVIIDNKPPQIRVLTTRHNVEKGGAGLVVYRLFEEDVKNGVMVGENYFPGHSGMFADKNIFSAFFAMDHTQGPGTRICVVAEDVAGNIAKKGFHHYIRDKNFKTDTLNISDRFLEFKMADFDLSDLNLPEGSLNNKQENLTSNPLLAKFLIINGKVRKNNVDKVLSIPKDTIGKMLWQGKFNRLAGAANRAGFADRRIYKYKGREIDRAVHMGIDLASTANAPVDAANSGRVIMAQEVGIFGKTIILDHGFGLASLYSHLTNISVSVGDMVQKGDIIGNTGLTGLAGGDHLHYSMIVHNVFVNPVEWWDKSWIKNNITSKIEEVEKQLTANK